MDRATTSEQASTKTILVCPYCGKSDLYYEAGLITGRKYHCKHCNYIGAFVVEMELELVHKASEEKDTRKNK